MSAPPPGDVAGDAGAVGGANGQPRLVVIMMTLNQREKTLACLESLLAMKKEPPFEVLLWDNGSDDGTAQAVREVFPQVHLHRHPTNLGVAPGRNAAAQLAFEVVNPTHIAFLDNDMEFEPDFLSELYRPFARDDRVAQTQGKLRFFHDRERLNDGGGCKVNFWLGRTLPVGYGEVDRGQYDTPKPCVAGGGAMIVRADVFKECGGFDTTYGYMGPEDLDLSLRITEAGYKVLYVPTAVAYHEVSHTYGRDYDESYARLKARNWFIFMRRHASIPQQMGFLVFGLPYGALSVLVREARRGNLEAVRGHARGVVDYLRSIFKS